MQAEWFNIPKKISSATYVDAAHSRGSSGKLDVGLSDRKRPFTPGPFGRLEVKTVVPSPPLSLEDITGDRRYCPAFPSTPKVDFGFGGKFGRKVKIDFPIPTNPNAHAHAHARNVVRTSEKYGEKREV